MNLKVVEEIQIDAQPEQIYRAWTDEHLLTAWWGNGEFRTTRWQGELRAGGHWRVEFADAKGNIYTAQGSYVLVQPPHRLSFTWKPDWDDDPVTTIELDFQASAEGTRLRLTQADFTSPAAFYRNQYAWSQTVLMLKRFLSMSTS